MQCMARRSDGWHVRGADLRFTFAVDVVDIEKPFAEISSWVRRRREFRITVGDDLLQYLRRKLQDRYSPVPVTADECSESFEANSHASR